MLRPYPTQIPSEAWQVAGDLIEGKTPATARAIHIVEDTVAFCCGKVWPDGPNVSAATATTATSQATCDEPTAEGFIAKFASGEMLPCDPPAGVSAGVIPWASILKRLIKLLLDNAI